MDENTQSIYIVLAMAAYYAPQIYESVKRLPNQIRNIRNRITGMEPEKLEQLEDAL